METIFCDMIRLIGYEKSHELVTSMKPTEEKPTVVASKKKAVAEEEKPKKKAVADDEKKKRIPRMSPTLATQLKSELGKVGMKYSDDDKKEFDKIKKEFVTYVDDLTEDDFTGKGLTDHMRDFANTKKPVEEKAVKAEETKVEKKTEDTKVVKTEEKPKKGGKKKAEEKPVVKTEGLVPSNVSNIHDVTLEDLQAIEMIVTVDSKDHVGTFWDADEGRWVRGPGRDVDEDIEETKFDGKTYSVGVRTGRVYDEETDSDHSVFCGFVGVGKFRGMKMPETD
jgi:hypothetical protein